jgi:hypothetical protein
LFTGDFLSLDTATEKSKENITSLHLLIPGLTSAALAHHQPHGSLLFIKNQHLHHLVNELVVDLATFDFYFISRD